MMDARQLLYRKSKSDNPDVAFPALVKLGKARAVLPSVDTGYKSYGTGRLFLPAATNLVPDPQGVLADGTFWPATTAGPKTTITGNVAVPVPVPAALSGLTKCLRLVNDGNADTPVTANLTVTESKNYHTSLYVYAPSLGGHLHISAETGHSFAVADITAANTGWTRYSLKTNTAAGEVTLHLHLAFEGGTASTVYITGAQCVLEAVVTDFFCGASTLGGATAWSGTANASTSTRTVSALQYAAISTMQLQGTLACRFSPLHAGATVMFYPSLVAANVGETQVASIGKGGAAVYRTALNSDGWIVVNSADQTFDANTTHIAIGRWNRSTPTADFTIDAVDSVQDATAGALMAPTVFRVSGDVAAETEASAHIGPVAIAPYRITDAETALLSTALAAGITGADLFRFFARRGYASTLILPLAGDSVGYKVV